MSSRVGHARRRVEMGGMELTMSLKERDRLVTLRALDAGRLTQRQAAEQLGITERQVRRSLQRFRAQGDAGLVHRSRGQPSNRRLPPEFREQVLAIVRERYHDFGPTFAAEKLAEGHSLRVSSETLRKWMSEDGLWRPKPRKMTHRARRERKDCFGEMGQLDGSHHDWFEGRAPAPVLISTVDDATSRIFARFAPAESSEAVMALMYEYLVRYGRPLAIYADRHSIYQVNRPASVEEQFDGLEAETQVGGALRELGIEYIPAYSPQAKGRVERSFGTAQHRLVRELRLAGIRDIDSANEFLDRYYLSRHNGGFAVPPACAHDAHRPIGGLDLDAILSHQETRTVTNDYTISYDSTHYQIARDSVVAGLRGGKVIVEERLDGSVHVRLRDRYLTVTALPPQPKAATEQRSTHKARREPTVVIPAADHPWRRGYQGMPDGPITP